MKSLYNLSYGEEYYVSTVKPNRLPDDNFSLLEITYNDEIVASVVGLYCYDTKRDNVILSDLEIRDYFKEIKGKCEIEFQGDPDVENKSEKVFIIMVCSYLSYFSFMKLPFELSLDLLDTKAFDYFTSFNSSNEIEKLWRLQVSYLHKNYGYIFRSEFDENREESDDIIDDIQFDDIIDDIQLNDIVNDITIIQKEVEVKEVEVKEVLKVEGKEIDIDMIRELSKKYVKEYAKDYVKGYMKEFFAKNIGDIEKASTQSIEKINIEAGNISKEVKEFKRRFLNDISKIQK